MTYDQQCPGTDVREPGRLELAAREVVENHLGVTLTYIDDNDGVDFCIADGKSQVGVMEVTRSTDEDWRRLQAQLRDFKTLEAPIDGVWSLDLDGTHGPNDVSSQLDTIATHLRVLEELEVDHFPNSSFDVAETEEALSELGLPSGYRWTSDEQGRIHLTPRGFRSWMGNEHIVGLVTAATIANMGKLKHGPGQRHLFLWVEFHALPAFSQLTEGNLPAASPDLYDSVDHVWVCQAHPLKAQEVLPLWLFDGEKWVEDTTPLPAILLTPE